MHSRSILLTVRTKLHLRWSLIFALPLVLPSVGSWSNQYMTIWNWVIQPSFSQETFCRWDVLLSGHTRSNWLSQVAIESGPVVLFIGEWWHISVPSICLWLTLLLTYTCMSQVVQNLYVLSTGWEYWRSLFPKLEEVLHVVSSLVMKSISSAKFGWITQFHMVVGWY